MESKNNRALIKNKLIFLVLMPIVALVAMTLIFSVDNYTKYCHLEKLEKFIKLSTKVSHLVHEIQIERGASVGYFSNKEDFLELLTLQRKKTALREKELFEFLKKLDKSDFGNAFNQDLEKALQKLSLLKSYQEKIDNELLSSKEIIAFYTQLNEKFLHTILYISKEAKNAELSLHLASYVNFLFAKDIVGNQRALVTGILNAPYLNKNLLHEFSTLRERKNIQ